MMGDPGARLLAKALQINTKLKNLVFDRNNVSLQGYSEIAYALERYVHLNFYFFDPVEIEKNKAIIS